MRGSQGTPLLSVVYPLGDFVTANTGVAASKDDAHAVLLAIQVFLRQVTVGGRLAHDNNGVTLYTHLMGLSSPAIMVSISSASTKSVEPTL